MRATRKWINLSLMSVARSIPGAMARGNTSAGLCGLRARSAFGRRVMPRPGSCACSRVSSRAGSRLDEPSEAYPNSGCRTGSRSAGNAFPSVQAIRSALSEPRWPYLHRVARPAVAPSAGSANRGARGALGAFCEAINSPYAV